MSRRPAVSPPGAKRPKIGEHIMTGEMRLTDWPRDWIVEVIRFVDCKSKAMFGCASKMTNDVARDVQETSAGCQSAMSVRPDVNDCIKEATRSALSRLAPSPTLAFLFVSPSFKDEALNDALILLGSLLPPMCELSGCHGMGLMGRDEQTGRMNEVDQGAPAISLLLLHSPEMSAKLTFIDVKSLKRQFRDRDPLSTGPVSQANKDWLTATIGVKDVDATSSFILLTSPTHLVTPFLRCLHELVPHALITGALASGGRPTTIALFSRQAREPIRYHTNGLVVLEVSRCPDRRTVPNALNVPPMTGFASRGCKACSNVYQIVSVARAGVDNGEQGDIIATVRLARTLQEDDASTVTLDEQMIRRLTGNEPLSTQPLQTNNRSTEFVTLGAPSEASDDTSRSDVVLDMVEVVRQMIERQASQEEGDINGLFIGISDEVLSKEGRILCDILEVQPNGVKIDTSIIQQEEAVHNRNQTVNLEGKYMQFLQLDSRASCLDLANRVRTATRKNQLRQLIEQKARHSAKFADYASILPPRPLGGLLLSCAGRGQGFFQHPNIDSQIVEYQGGGLQIAGFASSGEIGPPARSLQVQRWLEEMNLAAVSSLDQAASSITHNLRNDLTDQQQQNHSSSHYADDDESELISHLTSDAFVLPPTSIVSPAVLQSFTAVVTIFASQY